MEKYLKIGRVEFLPERLRRAFEEVVGEGVRFMVEEIKPFAAGR
ncbi:hypothetical protein [Thermosulfurimonas sp.]|nr:hypothetical protein [Thermosulfurimonas sp.]